MNSQSLSNRLPLIVLSILLALLLAPYFGVRFSGDLKDHEDKTVEASHESREFRPSRVPDKEHEKSPDGLDQIEQLLTE
jgi:hypothetical protein